MRSFSRIAIATILIASAVTTASAQVQGRVHGGQRVQTAPLSPTDPYGERPYNPDIGVPCSQRPFAPGCDKRGFW